jgi:hypothetical protein
MAPSDSEGGAGMPFGYRLAIAAAKQQARKKAITRAIVRNAAKKKVIQKAVAKAAVKNAAKKKVAAYHFSKAVHALKS